MRLQRMGAKDVDTCARIVAGDPLWQRYGLSLRGARQLLVRALASARRGRLAAPTAGELAVARSGTDVVGFIWFRLDGTFHHSGYVRLVAVAPEARGRGVGARLIQYAEEQIFQHGPNVYLLVSDFNVRGQAFYKRLGYVRVGALRDYVVPGITERLYRKTRGPILIQGRREQ